MNNRNKRYIGEQFIGKIKVADFYYPAIGVEWPMPEGMTEEDLILSEKDQVWGGIEEYKKERGL